MFLLFGFVMQLAFTNDEIYSVQKDCLNWSTETKFI